eukprot:COSAG01_NODE_8792_length_2657_cov_2.146599_2_plen_731_part_01
MALLLTPKAVGARWLATLTAVVAAAAWVLRRRARGAMGAVLLGDVGQAPPGTTSSEGSKGVSAALLVSAALGHALAVLDAVAVPRCDRRQFRELRARLEGALEDDAMESADGTAAEAGGEATLHGESQLSELAGRVEALCAEAREGEGEGGPWAEAAEAVGALLDHLNGRHAQHLRHSHASVRAACAELNSAAEHARAQGLAMLAALPRVEHGDGGGDEVRAAWAAVRLLGAGRHSWAEHTQAARCVFTLCFRCGPAAAQPVVGSEEMRAAVQCTYDGLLSAEQASGLEGMAAAAAVQFPIMMAWEAGGKSEGALREAWDALAIHYARIILKWRGYSDGHVRRLLPQLVELIDDSGDDVVSATGLVLLGALHIVLPSAMTHNDPSAVMRQGKQMLDTALSLHWRVVARFQPAEWWAAPEQLDKCSIDTMCLAGTHLVLYQACTFFHTENYAYTVEVVRDAVHLAQINQAAGITAQLRLPILSFMCAYGVLSIVSGYPNSPAFQYLLAPGVVESLLYATAHDAVLGQSSLAEHAAASAVNLIGKNESGLTLTREAVDAVMTRFQRYFSNDNRLGHYHVQRVLTTGEAILNITIADANKTFLVEHEGAFDALVSGLLLDKDNLRSQQEGAERLQTVCTLALQNLALSPISADRLKCHKGAMEALRTVAESGRTKAIRHSAEGALFELEADRHTVHLAAVAVQHIMLSYNWDHQDVIKRVHASLVRRGYTTWID